MNNRNRFFFFLLAWLMPLAMTAQTNHWSPQTSGYEDYMSLTGVIQINGVEQQGTTLEVGAFCGTECRASAKAVLFPVTGRYVVFLTIYGNIGDQVTFKLYDHSQGMERNLQSPAAVTVGTNGLGSVTDPYVLNFTEPNYTITASASPSNGGTVSGGGTYQNGSSCTLTATPATGYSFVRWTKNGSQVSTNASYSFTVTENATYVAEFSLNSYTISASANPSNGGSVSGAGSYNYGSSCTLTATPTTGYSFVKWTKNGSQVSTNASYSFTVTENATYVAVFSLNSYTISASANPSNGGSVSGAGSYNYGSSCTLTATPATGYSFVRWTKNGSQVSTNASYSFTVTESASYVAVFSLNSYTISASANPSAGGTVSGGGSYNYGSSCTLTATPATGYSFVKWTKNGSQVSTNPSYTFTVTANASYVAVFSYCYTITTSVSPLAGGTVNGSGTYEEGATCTLTAIANESYSFKNWTENGEVVSTEATYSFMVMGNRNLVANFAISSAIDLGLPSGLKWATCNVGACSPEDYGYYIAWGETSPKDNYDWSNYKYCNGDENSLTKYCDNDGLTVLQSPDDAATVNWGNGWRTPSVGEWQELYNNTTHTWVTQNGVNGMLFTSPNGNSLFLPAAGNSDYLWYVGNDGNYWSNSILGWKQLAYYFGFNSGGGDPLSNGYRCVGRTVRPVRTNSEIAVFSITANPSEGGMVSGSGMYEKYASCRLVASADETYYFVNWTKNGTVVSTNSTYSFVVTEDGDYVAHFALRPMCMVTAKYEPDSEDNQSPYVKVVWETDSSIHEDFETGTFNMHAWEFSPNNNSWIITDNNPYSGLYCMRSNNSGMGYTTASAQVKVNVPYDGQMSFYSRTSCNSYQYFGQFYIDDQQMDTWSGNGSWEKHVYDVTVGEHTFRWSYSKDGSFTPYDDCFYVDNISFVNAARGEGRAIDYFKVYRNEMSNGETFELIADNVTIPYYIDTEWSTLDEGWYRYAIVTVYLDTDTTSMLESIMVKSNKILRTNIHAISATIDPEEGGTITGTGEYDYGSTCTLTAIPNEGYTFMYWTEDGSWVSSNARYSFTVTSDRSLVAHFSLPLNVMAVASPTEGGIVTGAGEYNYGTTCTLTAEANEGYSFMYWTDNGNQVSTNATYSFTVTSDRSLVAHFSLPLNVMAVASPTEGGIVTGAGEYNYGTTCTLTATANEGYTFMYWTENGNQVSSNAEYTFVATSSCNLVAHFALPFSIVASVNPTEGGVAYGMGEYDYNTTCTLTAIANEGYAFVKWTKNGNVISYVSPYSFTVTEEAEYVAHFEETSGVIVGAPESTNVYLPSYSYYNYTLSQQIYTPEEIGGNTIITNLSFFNTGGQKTRNYDIYIVHTEKNTFENNTDWIAVTEADHVFSGDVIMLTGYWTTIVLDTPFAYNGTSNIAIIVDDNSGNWSGNSMNCRVFNANGNQAIRVYSDYTNYDPYHPSDYGGTLHSVKNQIIFNNSVFNVRASINIIDAGSVEGAGDFGYGQTCTLTATANEGYTFMYWTENGNQVSGNAEYSFAVTSDRNLVAHFSLPLTITTTINPTDGGTVSEGGVYDYGTNCTVIATANEGYVFLNWSKNGEVVSCNAAYTFTVTENADLEAVFMLLEGTLVGEGEATNVYLPSYSYWKYTLSQQIYTPDEIGATGFISTISYFNAGATKSRNYDIYMVHTDKTVFENNTDWIPVTEADLVFSGDVTMESGGWTTIVFDTPFAYDGISNLAIIVDDNSGNWTYSPHMACRTFNANGNQAIRIYSDNTNYDPYNPSGYNGTLGSEKNQIIFRIMPIYHFISNGTWGNAANWSGGVLPGINDAVSIDANCALNKDAEVAVLAITPGKTLTIRSGKTLTVTGTLANKATTGLVIKEGGQLINASGKVAATMEKGISAHDGASTGWYTIASPMNGMPIAGSDFVMPEYDLYRFNETNLTFEEWENYKANFADFTAFEKGRGYLYANSNDFTSTFTGILNGTSVTCSLTCTNRPNDPLGGFHLIGNPFPHEIYKGTGGAIDNANLASGYYTLDAEGIWQVHSFDDAILPGQGVLVKATAPTALTIAKSNEEAFAESGEAKRGMKRLCISVIGDNGQDRAYLYFGEGIGLDKVKTITKDAPNLAVRNGNGDFAIAHCDKKSEALELVFTTPTDGAFTLNVDVAVGDFEYLRLIDSTTGEEIDLLALLQNQGLANYTFQTSEQAGERIFKFVYKQSEM